MTPRPANSRPPAPMWSPWWTVVAFGMVSLAADVVYEGMRAVACGVPEDGPRSLTSGAEAERFAASSHQDPRCGPDDLPVQEVDADTGVVNVRPVAGIGRHRPARQHPSACWA